ncbi:MAG: S49 family peptidase [Nitrospinota bacterium]|nr:S49 family peptidase [Nitrospinota bacterium]
MKLLKILGTPWGIKREKYEEIIKTYSGIMAGPKIALDGLFGVLKQPLPSDYSIENGIAVIALEDVLLKKYSVFMGIFGGTSTEIVREQFKHALANKDVNKIVLKIDSPGGTVDGTQDLAKLIYDSRGIKPIVSFVDGMMHSAATWVGTSADRVVISNETCDIGGIGVVTAHMDISEFEKKLGVKTTEIYAGKYKRINSYYKPLSAEGKQELQDAVDYLYSVFVENIAQNRGVSTDVVLENMADGRGFIGKQAIEAGLVDSVSSFDRLMEELAGSASAAKPNAKVSGTDAQTKGKERMMDKDKLKADHPELYAAVLAEGKEQAKAEHLPMTLESTAISAKGVAEDYPAIAKELSEAGMKAERDRVTAIMAVPALGHGDIVASCLKDGKSADECASLILKAEAKSRSDVLADLQQNSPSALPQPASDAETAKVGGTTEEQAKAAWDKDEKLHAEFSSFESYLAYVKADKGGQSKIFKGGK